MTCLLIFDHLENFQAWRVYEYNVIQRYICQNAQSNNNLLNDVTMVKVTPGITLSNVTSSNNLLLNSYFEMPLSYTFYIF